MTILNTLKDSSRLTSSAVIIDVFRASNTIIELLHLGAREIIPVADERHARCLKDKNPDMLLFGERNGVKLPGFDGDNSPTGFSQEEIHNKTIILTTSGGTRCIEAARQCSNIFIGSFANSSSLIRHLKIKKIQDVSFWAVGLKAENPAVEDTLCAEYLSKIWHGDEVDFNTCRQRLLVCEGAERRRERNQTADLEFCLKLNVRDTVPKCFVSSSGDIFIRPAAYLFNVNDKEL